MIAAVAGTNPTLSAILPIEACETAIRRMAALRTTGHSACEGDCDMPCDVTQPNDGDRCTFTAIDADRDVVRKSLVAGLLIDVGNAGTIIRVAAVNRKPVG